MHFSWQEGDVELRHQRNPDCVFDFSKPKVPGKCSLFARLVFNDRIDGHLCRRINGIEASLHVPYH